MPVLYSPGGIVLSDIQQIVLINLEYFYLWAPSVRALVVHAIALLYTRIGSNRGNSQSTIMYRIQNIHTHSCQCSIIFTILAGLFCLAAKTIALTNREYRGGRGNSGQASQR